MLFFLPPAGDRLPVRLIVATLLTSVLSTLLLPSQAQAQAAPYCQQSQAAIDQKETLRRVAARGNKDAQKQYASLVKQHGDRLRNCRKQTQLQTQAIWLRLYPCDAKPGALESVLDQIVNRGYTQVNVESFYNGKVLLPTTDNPTAWTSMLAGSKAQQADLLAEIIRKGRARGLKVYAWLFGMNVGASYISRPDKQQTIARNGLGQTSLTASTVAGLSTDIGLTNPEEAFVDPYSPQARQDYGQMVEAIVQRKPDGVLFDYVRYPRGYGSASVASKIQDLWVYGEASQQTLFQRALNYRGMELIRRFLEQGYITGDDLKALNMLYPQEREPLWQGLNPKRSTASLPLARRVALLQADLWQLSVAHATQGVLDFVNAAVAPVQRRGIPAGVVFFSDGNSSVGRSGFDSRLQPWDRFPSSLEWHPMAYANCGKASCITAQIQRVLQAAPRGTKVKPVLAGIWQQSVSNRPPLEVQMQALQKMAPQVKGVSHFAYSWQEPGSDRNRKYCQP
ncbi:MAG TPA: family 10 glycosylhydrolase [Thermosynechococcaceae cyanobacterium]